MSYLKLIVVGNLGRDPEMRYMPDGTPVTNLNVATSRKWNNADGSKGEETTWIKVTLWRKDAENAAQYLKKGSKVLVEGRLNPDKATGGPKIWTKQDGSAGASYEMTAERIVYLSSKSEATGAASASADDYSAPSSEEEDVIPF
jgi:single-strand DNA-binding protein